MVVVTGYRLERSLQSSTTFIPERWDSALANLTGWGRRASIWFILWQADP